MDQVKQILAVLNKYQFWAICGVMLLVAFVCWWMATAGMATQFTERKDALEGNFRAVVITRGQPNQKVVEKIRDQQKDLKDGVALAWEDLYTKQKERNPQPKVVDEEFREHLDNLKPKEELAPIYREEYLEALKRYLPTLLEIVDARRPAAPATADGEWIGTVDWNESDFHALEDRFGWEEVPSTLGVLLAQEDLWVYEALLRVIRSTNEGATGSATAAIKQIEILKIGNAASEAWRNFRR